MVFKKKFFRNIVLSLCILCITPASAFFHSFSQVGHTFGFGITIDGEVTLNFHYNALFKNASNYKASVGLKILKMMYAQNLSARLHVSCRHNDGLDSLQQLTSLVAAEKDTAGSGGTLQEISSSGCAADDQTDSSFKKFLWRSFFALSKTIAFQWNSRSSKWTFTTGAEALTHMLEQSGSLSGLGAIAEMAKSQMGDAMECKKGKVSFDQELFNTLFLNHALQFHVVTSVLLAGQGETLQQQWKKIQDAWNEEGELGQSKIQQNRGRVENQPRNNTHAFAQSNHQGVIDYLKRRGL